MRKQAGLLDFLPAQSFGFTAALDEGAAYGKCENGETMEKQCTGGVCMKKIAAMLVMVLAMGLWGCSGGAGGTGEQDGTAGQEESGSGQDTGEVKDDGDGAAEQEAIRAVYLKNDYGDLFVDLQQESPFTGTIPQEILDEEGNPVTADQLNSGDVLDVYGNGIMLESYPGQYPGITKLVRVEKENQEYQEKYQEMLDQFCPAPDRSKPPQLSLSYRQTDAVVTAVSDQFGYQWEYTDENGETQAIAVDSIHVLQSEDLVQHTLEGDTQMTVISEYQPDQITVLRWETAQREKSREEIPEGENVQVAEGEEGLTFTAQPGYIYQIIGTWPEGEAVYGFETVKKE